MKKLLALILLLSALSVGCLFPTLGAFAMSSMNSGISQEMNHDMWGEMMMPCDTGNDSPSMHECCESPLVETVTPSNKISVSQGDTDNDSAVLYAIHESLISNSNDRLNSPPKYRLLFHVSLKNTYISLVGIIKNNA